MINELIEVDRRKDELIRIKKEEKKRKAEEKRKISKEVERERRNKRVVRMKLFIVEGNSDYRSDS